jgi:hypothetical protein
MYISVPTDLLQIIINLFYFYEEFITCVQTGNIKFVG